MTKRATLATVAASAGVSIATVSKVVNGRPDVGPATRALVEGLLQQHEYVGPRPGPPGRGRRTGVRPMVELVFQGDLTAYSTEIMTGLLKAGAELGVDVTVTVRSAGPANDRAAGSAWVREPAAAGRHAIIAVANELTAADLAAVARAALPLVVIDPLDLPHTRVTSVGSTNFAGGLAAVNHLLALGHRRIGYLGGPASAACNQARLHGYRAGLEAAGAHLPDGYVRMGHFRYHDGFSGTTALLDLPEPPTAVFAGNDEIAAGVIEAGRARGLRVPDDLSVVGFDDTGLARLTSPPLTTVRQPLQQLGNVALRTALRLASGETLDSHHVELATELVVRSSAAAPPGSRRGATAGKATR